MNGTKVNFNSGGKITTIVDTNGNATTFVYNTTTGRLETVKDAANRATSFAYNASGQLQTITDPANRTVTFTYLNGDLTEVTFNGSTIKYGYDTNHNLTSITDPRNNKVTYGYDSNNDRINSVSSTITVNGTPTLSTTNFTFGTNSTTVTNAKNIQTIYEYDDQGKVNKITNDPTGLNIVSSFGYDTDKNINQVTDPNGEISKAEFETGTGNLISTTNPVNEKVYLDYDTKNNLEQVIDPAGNISTAEYDANNNNTDITDPILQSSASSYNSYGNPEWETASISSSDNLVYNPSAERGPNNPPPGTLPYNYQSWTETGGTAALNWENTGKIGSKSISIANPTKGASVMNDRAITVNIDTNPNASYVVSGWLKTENLAQRAAYVKVDAFNSTGTWIGEVSSPMLGGTITDWVRLQLTVNKDTLPAGTATIKAGFAAKYTTGKAYFDGLQFEAGNVASTYNLVENSGVELDSDNDGILPDYWTGSALNTSTDKLNTTYVLVGNKSFKITGATGVNKNIAQRINISGDQNTKFTVSGWSYADNPDTAGGYWTVQVQVNYNQGDPGVFSNNFDKNKPNEWQHLAAYVKPTAPFSSIDVFYLFYNQRGNVYFDDLRLQEGDIITSYGYDVNNNFTTSITSSAGTMSDGYDSYGNRNKITDFMNNVTDFTFDPSDRLTKVTQPTININGQPVRYETNYQYDANGNRAKVTDAKGNATNYSYNEWNQLASVTDAANKTINYTYDILGRNNEVRYPNGNTVSFDYDNANRINFLQGNWTVGGTNKNYRYRFDYDNNGNVKSVLDEITNKTTTYDYSPENILTKVTEPGGQNVVSYVYDILDQVTAVTASVGGTNYTTNYSYDTLSRMTKVDAGNGNKATYTYDDNGNLIMVRSGNGVRTMYNYHNNRVSKKSIFDKNGLLMRGFTYEYNGNGNITKVTMDGTVQGNLQYTYDTLGRLTSETLLDGTLIEYQYDAVGNRTLKKATKSGLPPIETNYLHDNVNQLTSVNGNVYSYDANGNMTSDGSRNFVYDAANLLVQVNNGSNAMNFEYDGFGRRSSMSTSNGTVYFHYDGNTTKVLYETDANNNILAQYTYNSYGNLVSMTSNGQTYFYHYNWHGDVVALTDANGATVATYEYDAWGNLVSDAPAAGSIGDLNPYRYAGYRYDKDTGLYYVNARYYQPELGRFITRDSIFSTNTYSYTNNNPVNAIDPTGYLTLKIGDRGIEVELAQHMLNDLGYRTPITGVFDQNMLTQVNLLKNRNGLGNTGAYYGVIGNQTWDYLVTATDIKRSPTASGWSRYMIKATEYYSRTWVQTSWNKTLAIISGTLAQIIVSNAVGTYQRVANLIGTWPGRVATGLGTAFVRDYFNIGSPPEVNTKTTIQLKRTVGYNTWYRRTIIVYPSGSTFTSQWATFGTPI